MIKKAVIISMICLSVSSIGFARIKQPGVGSVSPVAEVSK